MRYWSHPAWTEREQAVRRIEQLERDRRDIGVLLLGGDEGRRRRADRHGVAVRDPPRAAPRRNRLRAVARALWGRGYATEMLRPAIDFAFDDAGPGAPRSRHRSAQRSVVPARRARRFRARRFAARALARRGRSHGLGDLWVVAAANTRASVGRANDPTASSRRKPAIDLLFLMPKKHSTKASGFPALRRAYE